MEREVEGSLCGGAGGIPTRPTAYSILQSRKKSPLLSPPYSRLLTHKQLNRFEAEST